VLYTRQGKKYNELIEGLKKDLVNPKKYKEASRNPFLTQQ
jgi:hypothetical protein